MKMSWEIEEAERPVEVCPGFSYNPWPREKRWKKSKSSAGK